MTKTNGKKRRSPSVERQLALALVEVLEDIRATPSDTTIESVIEVLGRSAATAQKVLDAHGYGDLESINSRVVTIEAEIAEAVQAQDGARLAKLGAALDRAKKGLPPLAAEKKPRARKPKTPKPTSAPVVEKKTRKKKDEPVLPLGESVAVECSFAECKYTGTGIVGSPCPTCSSELVAAESGAQDV